MGCDLSSEPLLRRGNTDLFRTLLSSKGLETMVTSKLHAILILVALSRGTSLTIPNEEEPKLYSEEILDIESVTDSVEFVTVQDNLEETQEQLQENLDLAISRNSVTNFNQISVIFVNFSPIFSILLS